jgi:16S rRNA (guanine966-N2)-methyltransferase
MRIVGGSHRGRAILAPEDITTRPTSDRVRETLFNMLQHQPDLFDSAGLPPLTGKLVLDAFAGSGALSFEALSRGAAKAILFESDMRARRAIAANASALGLQDRIDLRGNDACRPGPASQPADVIFLDPPYRSDLAEQCLSGLQRSGWIQAGSLIIVEGPGKPAWTPPRGYDLVTARRQGPAALYFLRPVP